MWKCKECGKEIVAEVGIPDTYEFSIDKKGKPDELQSYFFESIEEHIKTEPYSFDISFKCTNCDAESDDLKDIAEYCEE